MLVRKESLYNFINFYKVLQTEEDRDFHPIPNNHNKLPILDKIV
jgi:hypothetical protein